MRLHHLEITAFGPFAETATIDFDALSASGLFLLSGATGAGKTSVLDAVCFALYGDVPGDRSAAKRLRSDHAAPGLAPEVTLEVTLGGRRFRFVRSPAWQRPKKRGTGTTPQQACVLLQERRHGDWEPLSTRIDEVADLVRASMGMSLTQFCQVAMLPQGRFQAFLRSRSDERQVLLQQLFGTERFTRVEQWLRDRRLDLHRQVRTQHDEVAGLVNRLSEVADHPCPEEWDLRALESPTDEGALDTWVTTGLQVLQDRLTSSREDLDRLVTAADAAEESLRAARSTAERQLALRTAEAGWLEVLAEQDSHRERKAELEQARRAEPVLPLHHVAMATRERLVRFTEQLATHTARLEGLGLVVAEDAAPAELRESYTDVSSRQRELGSVLALEGSVESLSSDRDRLLEALDSARRERAAETARVDALPTERADAQEALARAQETAAQAPSWESRVASLETSLEFRREAGRLETELARAEDERRAHQDRAHASVQEWLDLREARLAGMAAEIAGDLAAGCRCPVCGSSDHPRPATASPGAPDAAAEREAQRHADDARAFLAAHDDQVQQLRTRLEVARTAATAGTAEELEASLRQAELELAAARTAAEEAAVHRSALDALQAEEQQLRERLRVLDRRVTELEARVAATTVELERCRREVTQVLHGTGHSSVADLCTHLEQVAGILSEAVSVRESHDLLATELAGHESVLATAVRDQGFATVAEALTAHRDRHIQRGLEQAIEDHDRQRIRLRTILEDPVLVEAGQEPEPDLPALSTHLATVTAECETVRARVDRGARALHRAEALAGGLSDALGSWAPVRAEHATVARLAALVEGKSADNRLQMRLSAYVLGYRLAQVVAAANVRLRTMSDQRYKLEHIGRRGAGETRGGLSLSVLDEWSGVARDPATLSGGETFIVSLALALGLADVISQESGGSELHTLFVDEGFGSLDSDSLDQVLDTLDSLRDGGRVVGVVSHVTEMTERIPTQLRVHKHRKGSTVVLAGAGFAV